MTPFNLEVYRAQFLAIDADERSTVAAGPVSDTGAGFSILCSGCAGSVFGGDHVAGLSPFGFGSDATVGLATVKQIAGELCAGMFDLPVANRYASGALRDSSSKKM